MKIFFVERRLNKARIKHLSNIVTRNSLLEVTTDPRYAEVLVANESSSHEILEYLSKVWSLDESFVHEHQKVVDITWLLTCIKEKKTVDLEAFILKANQNAVNDQDEHSEKITTPMENVAQDKNMQKLLAAKYACQMTAPLHHYNEKLTGPLEVLEEHAIFRGDKFSEARSLSFRRCYAALRALPYEIRNLQQLKNVRSIMNSTTSSKEGHCKNVIQVSFVYMLFT